MKKHLLKIVAFVFCMALFLTGCATVSDVKINGEKAYYKEAQYYQGQVVKVGDYIYYGNGYTASDSTEFSYKKAAKGGYLARLNVKNDLKYSPDVEKVNQKHTSPKGVEQVNDEKLIGYQYQDMYALGEYIYFTSANTHKTSNMENDYSQVSIFRVKYNGDDFKELVKDSAFKTGEGSQITLQKGSDGNYYFLIAEPTNNDTFSIKSLKVGSKIGELKTIVKNATSYVLADNTSAVKNIFYTVSTDRATAVKSIDFASGKHLPLINGEDGSVGEVGSETILLDRVGDDIFYSYSKNGTAIYHITSDATNFTPSTNFFYSAEKISNVHKAGEGFAFKTESGALMYHELESLSDPIRLAESSDFTDILFTEEDMVYISNSTSIKRISAIDKKNNSDTTPELIVEVKDMISGQCGYVDGYIYFYSKLGDLELEEGEDQRTDDRYYMYRISKSGKLELIGKTI